MTTPDTALFGTLARHLLRLEDRPDPEAARAAAADCAALAARAADRLPPVRALADELAAATAAVGDGRIPCPPALVQNLMAAADVLGANFDAPEADADACRAELHALGRAVAQAASTPPPSPAPNSNAWPPPGGPLPADALAQFLAESADSFTEAEGALLDLDGRGDPADAVARLFRAVHSIKGTAGYLGLSQVRTLSHKLESVLACVREGRVPWGAGAGDLIFQGLDHLKAMVAALTPEGEVGRDLSAFAAALDTVGAQARGDLPGDPSKSAIAALAPARGLTDALRALAAGECSDGVLGQLRVVALSMPTAAGGELVSILDRLTEARVKLGIAAGSGRMSVGPSPAAPLAPRSEPLAKAPAAEGHAARPGAKTVRVDQRKLDEYVNLAGELVIARNALVHAHKQFQTDRSAAGGLKGSVEKVCRIVGDLQNNAMSLRMVPVGTVFQRFPRLVRDVAKALDKQIELVLEGEETELDKQVAEALSDPLVHLVRNAADHGIEAPDRRRAGGKPESGTITLRAGREGNAILIEIRDDGGGINPERLKEKAVAMGVLTPDQAAALSREQALELVFAAGLSTAAVVSDLSGRGVGMDVVRNNIVALGGSVSLQSELGRGTAIRLSLPLTLAVTTVVLVEANGTTFGLPIDAVQETLKVAPDGFRQLRGVQAVCPRGDIIPVRPLGGAIGVGSPATTATAPSPRDRVPVVVLRVGDERFGVTVDALKGQQEIVLKPVPGQLGHIEGIGGATIMGDGSVVLILDPRGLYRRCASGVKDLG